MTTFDLAPEHPAERTRRRRPSPERQPDLIKPSRTKRRTKRSWARKRRDTHARGSSLGGG